MAKLIVCLAIVLALGQVTSGLLTSLAYDKCIEQLILDLPFAKGSGKLEVHHYLAASGRWNEDDRFAPVDVPIGSSTVIYVGGNTQANDAARLRSLFKAKTVHILEPVPVFFHELEGNALFRAHPDVYPLHMVGLAKRSRQIRIANSDLEGQATFVMDKNDAASGSQVLQLVAAEEFMRSVGITPDTDDTVVLHANCEGCEYEMLEALIESGLLPIFKVVQLSFHYFPGIPMPFTRYCHIRLAMEKTHTLVESQSQSYGWERWIRK